MASKRPRPPRNDLSPQDRELFLAACEGVVALEDRHLAPPPPRTPRPAVAPAALAPPAEPRAFSIEVAGERVSARSAGVSKAQMAELAAGKRHVSATLDLHGMTEEKAVDALRTFLARALPGGCVLVIHGKGLGSGGVAVLRDATFLELMGPSSERVLAFSTAAAKDGGEGATYVLVKR